MGLEKNASTVKDLALQVVSGITERGHRPYREKHPGGIIQNECT